MPSTGIGTLTVVDAGKVEIFNQSKVSPGAVGKLFAATCDIFVAALTPTGATQFGDLSLPAWPAYAAQAITWNNSDIVVTGTTELLGDSVEFALPSGAVGQTVYGWAVSSSTPILVGVYLLTTPVLINFTGTLVVVPFLQW